MRIALAQLRFVIGDFEGTIAKIRDIISSAEHENADLVVFAELCLAGYPARDFFEFSDFISRCRSGAEDIASSCKTISAIVGLPTVNPRAEGKNLHNSACLLQDGKISATVNKALLPTYDIFDEYRYFEPGRDFTCIKVKDIPIALTICEDLWNLEDDPMYISCPMDELIRQNPRLMINIAASPFDYSHAETRKDILFRNVKKYGIPLLYVNHVGAQTELIFDGGSLAINHDGNLAGELKYFEEEVRYFDFDPDTGQLKAADPAINLSSPVRSKAERIHDALVLGIRDYFGKQGFTTATLGLSGGIDSALVTVLASHALGPENVHVLLMPSQFSSEGSVSDSLQLIQTLGIRYDQIAIGHLFDEFRNALTPMFGDRPFNVTEENIQARIRGVLLMALSNKFGYILLNTSNKSEIAVGYGTLYGDMCGGLSVLGDVYKTEVYDLAQYINRNSEVIPENIITKPPSAELRPGQKDSDSLPDYTLLDPVLYHYIEHRRGPEEIIALGFEPGLVKRILKMVNINEYKRYQTPPILRVSPKAFGMGRRLPIVARYLS
ncbi:MAG: NAD+ synthase [Bacteroidia bacterium]|nr:NAD+ synthase [Bacteroidia bacterium]